MRANRGTAALEFAIVVPVLVVLILGVSDLSNAILTARRAEVAAIAVAQMASTDSAQSQTLNEISDVEASSATTAAFALFPCWARSPNVSGGCGAAGTFAVTLSGISFTAVPSGCTQTCSYQPKVVWSVSNVLGENKLRPCGDLAVVANSSPFNYGSIPAGDVGPTTLFVADVSWTFTPAFFGFLFPNIPIFQSATVSPRIGNGTVLTGVSSTGNVERC